MFTYPLLFNSEDEHINHIKTHQEFYRKILDLKESNEELENQLRKNKEMNDIIQHMNEQIRKYDEDKQKQEIEIKRTKELIEDTARLEELLHKKNGVSVVHKGICDEKYVEIILKEIASKDYIVDNGDGTRMMDIRLIRKNGDFTIGIECKDKDTVTKADIEKFRRDKIKNNFKRSIFISTSPIKNIVDEDNQIKINYDELFIVTKDHVFLAAVIKLYLANLETEKDTVFEENIVFDNIIDTYNSWQTTKKHHIKLDQSFLRLLNLTPDFDKNVKGHLYLGIASKYKAGKTPY